jgi:hypothetical protein
MIFLCDSKCLVFLGQLLEIQITTYSDNIPPNFDKLYDEYLPHHNFNNNIRVFFQFCAVCGGGNIHKKVLAKFG